MELTPRSLTPRSLTPKSLTPRSLTPLALTPRGLTPRGINQGHVFSFDRDADSFVEEDKELQSKWAAIEKLPTFKRIKTSFVDVSQEEGGSSSKEADGKRVIDVTKLGAVEKRLFIDRLIKHIENDNLQLLQKLRERMDRVNVKLPTVEVKYKNLHVEAECEVVQGKPLPTLWNSFSSLLSVSVLPP